MTGDGRPEDAGGPPAFPPGHPLHGHESKMVDHAGHIQAYSDALNDVDPEDVNAVMLVLSTDTFTETFPTVHGDADAQDAAFRMLAANISHIASALGADPGSVASHALHVLGGMQADPGVYGDD